MIKTDYMEFSKIWIAALDTYGRTPSDSAVDLCFGSLARYDIKDIRRGLSGHLNDPENGRFFPKPADIVRQIDGDSESRALMAWSKVEGAIRGEGSYRTVIFDEPEIMASVSSMGGWIRLCEMLEDDLPFRRNEFCKLYKGFLISRPVNYPSKFIGRQEAYNSADYEKCVAPPVMIGDYDKAVKILTDDKAAPKQRRVFAGEMNKLLGKTV